MHVAAFAFVCIMIQASPDVILVNEQDEPIGTMEKMAAHQSPHLHRAFSIFLFDKQQRMLLQQRAHSKYHSAGLWTNTCCSHPYPGEPVADAAARRLKEEMAPVHSCPSLELLLPLQILKLLKVIFLLLLVSLLNSQTV